jgi:hypothetical protein
MLSGESPQYQEGVSDSDNSRKEGIGIEAYVSLEEYVVSDYNQIRGYMKCRREYTA